MTTSTPAVDPGTGSAVPFAVTAPPTVTLTAGAGRVSFTVTNLAGRPVRARLVPRGGAGAADSWFSVVGPAEIPMAVGATATVEVAVAVPADGTPGDHTLLLEVVAEDDTEAVTGQSVAFTVAPRTAGRPVPWLLILVGALVVLVLAAGSVWFFVFRTPSTAQTPPVVTASPSATPAPPADACIDGFTWRLARDGDHVCVTQATRDQVVADNAVKESRWVAGAYGPHTCLNGYVWREAFSGDDVCVTGDVRAQARADNAAAPGRVRT